MSAQAIDEDNEIIECWRGARGTYNQLFDDGDMDGGCGGLGMLNCHCGGDLCICHNHGEIECFGCDDCEPEYDDDDDGYYDED